jgi:3-mercaptopyruvate sulfurtransferase SseA
VTGFKASMTLFAVELAGVGTKTALYDGSWNEWK